MANKTINDLTAASALTGAELVHVEQGGNSRKAFASALMGQEINNVTDLLADTTLTYTAGTGGSVTAGDIVRTRAEGFSYEVAASSATDHHVTTAGGVKLYRVYLSAQDFDVIARPSAPSAASTGNPGSVNGTVYYAVSYVTDDGGETEVGSRVGPIVVTNNTVSITNIPVSTNRRVVARKIYRTPNGAADAVLGKLLATINDKTTTTYLDDIADGALGADAPWTNTTGGYFRNGAAKLASFSGDATSVGLNALPNVSGGYACTAIGSRALGLNTSGYRNTAVGVQALSKMTTGNANTGVGVHAGEGTTTGSGNVSLGYASAQNNSAGNENLAIGAFAMQATTSGDRNVAIGHSAMQLRSAGSNNVGIGYQAGRNGSGTGNVNVGRSAGAALATANFTTTLGDMAGNAITSGSGNTVIGANAGTAISTGASNVCLGASAGNRITTENNRLFIDVIGRADFATAVQLSLIYGVFNTARATQQVHTNGLLYANAGVAYPSRSIVADYTVDLDDHLINVTGTGTVTLTLPNPVNSPGKVLHIKNKAAFTVVSNTSNVQPIAGGASGTAILPATAGTWAILQAVGSAWEITAAG